jgi:hypothetical protein
MALFIPGKTICPICKQTIMDGMEIIAFPAFLPKGHALSKYSDAVFHRGCFEKAPHRDEVQSIYKRYCDIWESRPRNLKSLEEIEAWGREALKDFP